MATVNRIRSRAENLLAFGARYKPFGPDHECIYCGGHVEVRDHVPALVHAERRSPKKAHVLVASCNSCNQSLGPHPSVCIKYRAEYLARFYASTADLARVEAEKFRGLKAQGWQHVAEVIDAPRIVATMADAVRRRLPMLECPCEFCKRLK